jgi:hypothetical protein
VLDPFSLSLFAKLLEAICQFQATVAEFTLLHFLFPGVKQKAGTAFA